MADTFYVTTPIYYVNDIPHIGHAYTTTAADVLARYNRQLQKPVFFLTGTDEHGQKVEEAARNKGLSPKEHADRHVENFRALWKELEISNDAFIRTTDTEHKKIVQEFLQQLHDGGLIKKRSYEGWYCTPDERFWTEKDLVEGACPECMRPVSRIEEENYFFLMSKYGPSLVKHIEKNPHYILPETRKNEVLGFLKARPLGDLCISRPKSRLSWGVELPFDPDFVTYVWFDALLNYYTGTRYLNDKEPWWPASHHLIGKDILTTHAVYWSTMLMALGLELPGNIFAHGWWTVEGKKMSKSLGNVVDPFEMAETYGAEPFRYFLLREVPFGNDGDFSIKALESRVNTDLANDFGNLLSRSHKMTLNYRQGTIPEPQEQEKEFSALSDEIPRLVEKNLSELRFDRALEEIWKLITLTNKYIDTNAPWALAKDEAQARRLDTVLYTTLEAVRLAAYHLHPFMPEKTRAVWKQLGLDEEIDKVPYKETAIWGALRPGAALGEAEALFPRIQPKKEQQKKKEKPKKVTEQENKETKEEKPAHSEGLISIEDVMKIKLKTARVLSAEAVKGSNKLVRLEVDSGEKRQLVAGIGKCYSPEELVGKTIVVVSNLKPAKLMGVESEGMLLAATDSETGDCVILTTEKDTAPGSGVK